MQSGVRVMAYLQSKQTLASVFPAVLHVMDSDFNYKSRYRSRCRRNLSLCASGYSRFFQYLARKSGGTYRLDDYSNEYHEGDISLESGALQWANRAGVAWELDAVRDVRRGSQDD